MSLLRGFGDSNVELGGGSMTGVVQINKEGGTGGVVESNEGAGVSADSFVGEGPVSFISGRAESVKGSTESWTTS